LILRGQLLIAYCWWIIVFACITRFKSDCIS
jgi:hypothetical protein